MKIILFSNLLDFGGVSNYFIRMNEAFNKNKIDSKLIYFKNERKEEDIIKRTFWKKINFIRENCIKNNSDFIITNFGLETIMSKIAVLFLKKKIKVISTVHIRSVMWIPKYRNKLKTSIFKLMIKMSFGMCDKCIAVSNGLREEIIKEKWIKEEKIITIYNPIIDDDFECCSKSIEGKEEIHLAIIGWIWDIKNQMEAIEALYELNDRKYKLHIIGGIKNQEYFDSLISRINELNLTEQVIFEGIKTDIYEELKKIDILILCSKTEALPTVIIEAMASGVPVIATNCKFGPSELVKNNIGYIYKLKDQKALVNYINSITKNINLYKNFSEKSIEESKKFKYSNIEKLYMKFLTEEF